MTVAPWYSRENPAQIQNHKEEFARGLPDWPENKREGSYANHMAMPPKDRAAGEWRILQNGMTAQMEETWIESLGQF